VASLKTFLKDNYVLVVGIALPVVLVVLFFLAMVVPSRMAPPPQYDFLFTLDGYQPGTPPVVGVRYDVYRDRLRATLIVDPQSGYRAAPRLFVYEVGRRTAREIVVDLPAAPEDVPDDRLLRIEEVADLYIDPRFTAPDGYEFHHSRYSGSGGLFTELFVSGRSRYEPALVRDGVSVHLELPTGRYNYHNAQFLGWVLPKP
jgi:hypothetical protein